MKQLFFTFTLLALISFNMPAFAAEGGYVCPMHSQIRGEKGAKCTICGMMLEPAKGGETHMKGMDMSTPAIGTIKVTVVSPHSLESGKANDVTVKLADLTGKPVTFQQLKTAHTKKFHALIIDETLSDYNHIHPVETKTPGEYSFSFTPKKNGNYRLWADLLPITTGKQEYAITDLKGTKASTGVIDKTVNNTSTVDGLTFKLSFESPLKTGKAVMGKVMVTKDGKPFAQLEPIMAAYAHIVGFNEDRKTVVHIHPMGKEPMKEADRGGPELEFHIEPNKSGFTKLFVQIRVDGKDIFAPFGVMIE